MSMNSCYRCNGFITVGYDAHIRESYQYCVNCGARPGYIPYRADQLPLDAPIPCRKCKQQPVVTIKRPIKGEIRSEYCATCRIEHLALRRAKKAEPQCQEV